MKYAKKIIVYPPARSDPLTDKIIELDKAMTDVLAKKGLNAHEKVKLYNDILTKTLSIENQYKNRFAEDETPQAGIEVPKNVSNEDEYVDIDDDDGTSPMDITASPKPRKKQKQKRRLDETMPLVDSRGRDVTNVFQTKRKRGSNRVDPAGNKKRTPRIRQQQTNQLLKAWEEFERASKVFGSNWLPIEIYDKQSATTRSQAKKPRIREEEKDN